ncbi:MAG: hypothetical protein L0215_05620 [Gemmataceae bacterium]|nr:hypothetical protein [Gemmataceae bacterium]
MKALLIFAIWRGLYWGLVGAFFWSIGYVAGHFLGGEDLRSFGGVASLSFFSGVVLATAGFGRIRAATVPMLASGNAGIFAGILFGLSWLNTTVATLAAFVGFFIGLYASIPKSLVGVRRLWVRFVVGATAGAAAGFLGLLFPGGLGWTIGGAVGGFVLGGLPALFGPNGLGGWRLALEWTLCGAIAGALAGYSGEWLSGKAGQLRQPPFLGLHAGDAVVQLMYLALLLPLTVFFATTVPLLFGRRWRQRRPSTRRSGPQPGGADTTSNQTQGADRSGPTRSA